MALCQVNIRRGAIPLTDPEWVTRALITLLNPKTSWGTCPAFEPEDTAHGIWLVDLPDEQVALLEADGWLEIRSGRYSLSAEMP